MDGRDVAEPSRDKVILVTGAGGFVGQCIVHSLGKFDYSLIAHYRSKYFPSLVSSAELVRGDLRESLEEVPCCSTVVHCAADIPSHERDEKKLWSSNVDGTENLLRWASDFQVKRFIFLSSLSVYGNPEGDTINEKTPCNPIDHYGESKLRGEEQVTQWGREDSSRQTFILRLPAVVGPGSHSNFPSDLKGALQRGEPVTIFNPQASYNHLVHVDNLNELLMRILRDSAKGQFSFVLGSENPISIQTVTEILKCELSSLSEITTENKPYSKPKISLHGVHAFGHTPWSVERSIRQFAGEEIPQN